jgi:hypothetical protein
MEENSLPLSSELVRVRAQRHKMMALSILPEHSSQSDYLSLDSWEALPKERRAVALQEMAHGSQKKFNKQDNTSVEWAQWTWNPVTGCLHNCPYCYARDIALRFYGQKFEPVILPDRLRAAEHECPGTRRRRPHLEERVRLQHGGPVQQVGAGCLD